MIWMGAIILLLGSLLFVYVPLIFLLLFTLPHRVNILSLVYINDLHCEFLLLQTVSDTSVSYSRTNHYTVCRSYDSAAVLRSYRQSCKNTGFNTI